MSCDRFPNCESSFVTGPRTKDGRKTYYVVCPAGLPGGCPLAGYDETIFTDNQSGKKPKLSRKGFFLNGQIGQKYGPFRSPDERDQFAGNLKGDTQTPEDSDFDVDLDY